MQMLPGNAALFFWNQLLVQQVTVLQVAVSILNRHTMM